LKKKYQSDWLLSLDYPYFIGSVDIINSTMEIYSINLVTALPLLNENCNGLILNLDDKDDKEKKDKNVLELTLGDPILTLSTADILTPEILNLKRKILKKWVLSEYENIKTRNIGLTKSLIWETNRMPEFNTVNKLFGTEENINIYGQSFDFIDATLSELKLFNDISNLKESIEIINQALLKKGIELYTLNNYDLEKKNFDK